ncbi:unnamed protein product [Cuscuta campestris]|uniref:Uncharacterized protein n=1 Tax=Cuscuta campestris TaxID=132261 RepID=A0A484KDT2_9ASTE|nr:unnamed protein product [Cuscuta campestris]
MGVKRHPNGNQRQIRGEQQMATRAVEKIPQSVYFRRRRLGKTEQNQILLIEMKGKTKNAAILNLKVNYKMKVVKLTIKPHITHSLR